MLLFPSVPHSDLRFSDAIQDPRRDRDKIKGQGNLVQGMMSCNDDKWRETLSVRDGVDIGGEEGSDKWSTRGPCGKQIVFITF